METRRTSGPEQATGPEVTEKLPEKPSASNEDLSHAGIREASPTTDLLRKLGEIDQERKKIAGEMGKAFIGTTKDVQERDKTAREKLAELDEEAKQIKNSLREIMKSDK